MICCPQCRAKGEDVYLQEIWAGDLIEFQQDQDGRIDPEGVLIQKGDPVKVQGVCCRCLHRWTLRGVFQIINLPGHPDHGKYRR